MNIQRPNPNLCAGSRREFLWQMGAGFTGLALTALLDQEGFFGSKAMAATPGVTSMTPRIAHLPKRAKSCIFLCMYGGPSQMDLFDYKPELQKRHGETDELGHEAAVDKHHIRDLHATLLQLMGLEPEKLTYFYGGLNQKLTGVVEPEVNKGLLS